MTECKPLDSYFKELLATKIEVTSKFSTEEVGEMDEAVTTLVHQLARSAITQDPFFQSLNEFARSNNKVQDDHCERQLDESVSETTASKDKPTDDDLFEIIPVGSAAEGTKIRQPDERDFLLLLKVFSDLGLEVRDEYMGEKHPYFKYVYIPDCDDLVNILRDVSPRIAWIGQSDGPKLSSGAIGMYMVRLLRNKFSELAKERTIIRKKHGQLKCLANIRGLGMKYFTPLTVVDKTGPAVTVRVVWESKTDGCSIRVDVDIVPTLVIPKQPHMKETKDESMLGITRPHDEVHLITLKTMSEWNMYSKKEGAGQKRLTQLMLSFLPSYSDLEVKVMQKMDKSFIEVYKILKYFMSEPVPCGTCCRRSGKFRFDTFVETYMLKSLMIRHHLQTEACSHACISDCVLTVLRSLLDMAQTKQLKVQNVWNGNHNLFETKSVSLLKERRQSEYEKEISSFERHLILLIKMFEDIENQYAYEKYVHYFPSERQ